MEGILGLATHTPNLDELFENGEKFKNEEVVHYHYRCTSWKAANMFGVSLFRKTTSHRSSSPLNQSRRSPTVGTSRRVGFV